MWKQDPVENRRTTDYNLNVTDFVHLHNHTDYSLLDGAAPAAKYVKKCQELGMDAIAITDHGNMYGVMDFIAACTSAKPPIKPIVGCEFYMCPEGRETKGQRYHLILLAMNEEGYHNLMMLNSIAFLEGFYEKPRIDRTDLEKYNQGLICMSACLAGEVSRQLLSSDPSAAYETARWYKNLFGDRYYIEIQNHGIKDEITVLPKLVALAGELGIKTVATNDIHYIEKSDANAHDILLCIGTGAKKSDEKRMRFEGEEFYLKSGDEMAALFADYPDSVSNTREIADRCVFELKDVKPTLPVYDPSPYESTEEMLKSLAWEGLKRRYPGYEDNAEQKEVLTTRLSYELSIILKMHFDSYFLIVRDYIYWAKTHDIPVGAGRGSGAGSLVAYCIDITNVDPIAHDLLFERFLNPDRVSLPDFDIDFCEKGRADVLNYVTQKYGVDHVAQIATFGTLKAKAVVKDVARVLDIGFNESNLITKLIPDDIEIEGPDGETITKKVNLKLALQEIPELKEYYERGGIYKELFDVSLVLEGQARHVSKHACGVVIGRNALNCYVPLARDPKTKAVVTQYSKDYLEGKCGLVKMDFLGLKTLTLLKDAETQIKERDPGFSLETLPQGDKETYAMMSRGDSTMVFQFESAGMKANLKLLKPTRFEELDAMTSLYRPGPMEYIPLYINTKNGVCPVESLDPCLDELLAPTYGVIVYQEQVMKVSQIYAGFTLGEADILRKIMGKKKVKEIPAQEEKFVKGAVAKGHSEADARAIFEHIKPFAGYGFNKSHSVCYTVLSYRTAYLKCHYPAEFYAANLTSEISNSDKLKEYLSFVASQGIKILPPSINHSGMFFKASPDGNIVYGLAGLKGMGESSVTVILEEREKGGPFRDFLDFLKRCNGKVLSSSSMRALISCGAFDEFGYNRPTLLANYEQALASIMEEKEYAGAGQSSLFGADELVSSNYVMKETADWDFVEKLDNEKEYLGLYVSGHPLDLFKAKWQSLVKLDISKEERFKEGIKYDLIGMVVEIKEITVKKDGTKMARVNLEDYNGRMEVTVFPKSWAEYSTIIQIGKIIGVRGSFKLFNEKMSFGAEKIFPDPMLMPPSACNRIVLEMVSDGGDRNAIIAIRNVCKANSGPVAIEFNVYRRLEENGDKVGPMEKIVAGDRFKILVTDDILAQLKGCRNVIDVYKE